MSRPNASHAFEEADQHRILKHIQADDAPALVAHLRGLSTPATELRVGGEDILTLVIRRNARRCIEPLTQFGFGMNRFSPQEGKHPIEEAMDARAHLVLEYLLEYGANPNAPHTQYGTVMRAAAATRIIDSLIPLLCFKGGDPNSIDPRDESTPLHAAVLNDQTLNVEQLLECGAFVDAVDFMGRTPLHLAMQLPECTPIATLLLDHGANPLAPDVGGLTPADLAQVREEEALVRALMERVDWPVLLSPRHPSGIPFFRVGAEFRQRLVDAVRKGNRRIVLELLDQGGRAWTPVESPRESPLLQALVSRRLDLAAPLIAQELGLRDTDPLQRNVVYYLLFATNRLDIATHFLRAIHRVAPELLKARDKAGNSPLDAALHAGALYSRADGERLFAGFRAW